MSCGCEFCDQPDPELPLLDTEDGYRLEDPLLLWLSDFPAVVLCDVGTVDSAVNLESVLVSTADG